MKKFMNTPQLVIAIIITTLCALGIISQQIWHCIEIDEKTIFFFALGTFPWLTLYFKKFKFPGFEGESYDRAQSNTDKLIPPQKDTLQINTSIEISADGKKILATLWRYQKMYFKDDYSKRWTFSIFTSSPEFPHYISGLAELLKKGYVSGSSESNQILLTNEGIKYLETHKDIQDLSDIYIF